MTDPIIPPEAVEAMANTNLLAAHYSMDQIREILQAALPHLTAGDQGEPVAWAWERSTSGTEARRTHWTSGVSLDEPADFGVTSFRNVTPLYARKQDPTNRFQQAHSEAKRAADEARAQDGGFALGDRVTKKSGSSWTGRVVGFYSTSLNPDGVCVESENETGSVQIYPAKAMLDAAK